MFTLPVIVALFTFAFGAWNVRVWANHWYIAEHFYYPDVDEAAKVGPYGEIAQRLRSGNEALRDGFVLLAATLVLVGLAIVLRRFARRQYDAPTGVGLGLRPLAPQDRTANCRCRDVHRGPAWYQKLQHRWAYRQAVARGPLEFTGGIDRVVLVPVGSDGRPGYWLSTAGPSAHGRVDGDDGRTDDFLVRSGLRSHLMGFCSGRLGGDESESDLFACAAAAAEHVVSEHANFRARMIGEPIATSLAGERAVAYTLQATSRLGGTNIVTDTHFHHDGWSFTVGHFRSSDASPDAPDLAHAILDSWTWLPAT